MADNYPYCEVCGCCAELPCCDVAKFLNRHANKCKYYDIYRKEIIDNLDILQKPEK